MTPEEVTRLERLFSRAIESLVLVRAAVALGQLPTTEHICAACSATEDALEELAGFENVRYGQGGLQHV